MKQNRIVEFRSNHYLFLTVFGARVLIQNIILNVPKCKLLTPSIGWCAKPLHIIYTEINKEKQKRQRSEAHVRLSSGI